METAGILYNTLLKSNIQKKRFIYDVSKIRVFTIDIETAAENGFPNIETA